MRAKVITPKQAAAQPKAEDKPKKKARKKKDESDD